MKQVGLAPNHLLRYNELSNVINELNPNNVLELGAGYGFAALSYLSAQIILIDINKKELKFAKKMLKSRNNVELIVGDIFNLPLTSFKFNVVVCSEVIEHLSDDEKAIKICYNLVEKDGWFICTVPNVLRLYNRFYRVLRRGRVAYMSKDHKREYTLRQIINILERNGFKVKEIRGIWLSLLILETILLDNYRLPIKAIEKVVSFQARFCQVLPELCNYILLLCRK